MDFSNLKAADESVFNFLKEEIKRQETHIELIASENFVSPAVMEAMGSQFTNKYAEGYPGKRYYGGCEVVDEVESLAIERLCKLFNSEHANVQPHSGANANLAAYLALIKPGDKVLGMNLSEGGHLTHGSPVNISGMYFDFAGYGVNKNTEMIDYDEVEAIAKEVKPKLIVAGASAYPRKIDFEAFKRIADNVGAKLMVDMAHIAGLVCTGYHDSPIPYADITTTTTHKTLRGPRGGAILCSAELQKAVDKAVFPGTQGGPLEHVIAAKAVAFGEALKPEFKDYAKQVVNNAKVLSESLINHGFRLVSGGTDNHLILIDLNNKDITGKEAEAILNESGIAVNKNTIPNETRSPFVTSGIRIGTPSMTTRGMKEAEMERIAALIDAAVSKKRTPDSIRKEVEELCSKFPLYK